MAIWKIFRSGEWASFEATGRFEGSADDRRDGFIHLSDDGQLAGTLARHFAGEVGLVLAEVDVADDPALRWEVSRGGASFPHLYRALARADVVRSEPGAA
jgi:uncharacterized protein (DUF952 family)